MLFPREMKIVIIVILLVVFLVNPVSPQVLSGKKIILDPGHFSDPAYQGTSTPSTSPAGEVYECYYVLDLANDIKHLLESNGASVYLTRTANDFIPYTDRIAEVNSKYTDYDIWISLHENGADNPTAHGAEYVYDDYVSQNDHDLGTTLIDGIVETMGTETHGDGKYWWGTRIYYTFVTESIVRTLTESGFMTCTDSSKADYWMWTPGKRKLEARAIFNGICEYFGIAPQGDSFEPDNGWEWANEQLPNTSSSVHSIDPAGDEDWIYFTLPSLLKVIIETRGPSGDAQMWLYDSSLQQLAYDDDDGTGLFPKIVELLLPGTYYVKVEEYGNNDIIPEYYIDLTATACEHPCIAVTDPYYDDIGAILASMGYEYIEIQDEDIADYDHIRYFDVIFINCSWDCSDNAPAAQSSLEQFVREGGYVYASDWAFIYVETSFPGHIFFPAYPYIGDTGYVQANVVDMGLAEYLGKSTMQIHFDLSSWVVIQDIAPDVSVYLRGTVETEADTAQTSLSLSEPVHPPTSREPSSTIQSAETMATIPDMPLCMSFEYGEGRVLFTTFHNEPQVSEDERKLLEYLVLIPYTGSLSDELANVMEDSGYDVDKESLGTINQGEVSGAYKFSNVKVQNLAFGANWAGSTIKLSVYEPGGNLYEEEQSDQPPLVIRVQQAEVGEWSYSITAVDIPYDNYPYVLQVGSSEGIPLAISWNLISLPLRPPNTDPDAVLSSITGLYNSVWAYDPDTGWSIYAPDVPSDLEEIVPCKGYWIKMDEPGTLDIQGTIPESTAVLLKGAKWNLAGYCSLDRKDVEDCNLPDCISSVWEYNANTGWSIYAPGWLTDLEAMKPGCGYWMKVRENHPEDCVWDVNQPISLAAPPLTMRARDNYISEDRPEMPYMVWGSVEIDGEKITGDGTVVLKVDGKIQSSYTLGTVEGYGDCYVLSVPAVIDSYSRAELYVQIGDNKMRSAIVPPGRPGDIIRFDLSVRTPPKISMLHQNYPNPFNPDTWIPYQLSEGAHLVIKIYAATGQLARTLNLGHKPAGFYTDKVKAAYWDGKNEAGEHVASGIYFCTIQASKFTATRKMVMTR